MGARTSPPVISGAEDDALALRTAAVIAFAVGLFLPSPFGDGGGTPSQPQAVATAATTDELDSARAAALPLVD